MRARGARVLSRTRVPAASPSMMTRRLPGAPALPCAPRGPLTGVPVTPPGPETRCQRLPREPLQVPASTARRDAQPHRDARHRWARHTQARHGQPPPPPRWTAAPSPHTCARTARTTPTTWGTACLRAHVCQRPAFATSRPVKVVPPRTRVPAEGCWHAGPGREGALAHTRASGLALDDDAAIARCPSAPVCPQRASRNRPARERVRAHVCQHHQGPELVRSCPQPACPAASKSRGLLHRPGGPMAAGSTARPHRGQGQGRSTVVRPCA